MTCPLLSNSLQNIRSGIGQIQRRVRRCIWAARHRERNIQRSATAEPIDNAAPGDVHQPALERTLVRVVGEIRHFPRDPDDRFLNHVFRLRIAQTGPDCRAVNDLPVGVKEFTPTGLIIEITQPLDQRPSRGQQFVRIGDGLGAHRY